MAFHHHTLHRTFRTAEMALRLSAARAHIHDAREWFNQARISFGNQDFVDMLVEHAHGCRRAARRNLAIVLRHDRERRAALYQDLACDAYRHADQLRNLPDAHSVMARQAAYYASTARHAMGIEAAVRS